MTADRGRRLRWPIMRILLLNGPNLNLLGTRAPDVYGATTLREVEELCLARAEEYGHRLDARQSNHEGDLIDAIQEARHTHDAIVFNPGAYTHTSYALHDAIDAAGIPTVEIHISNVREREPWRRTSRTAPACVYQIFGRGVPGYLAAISHLHYRAAHPPLTLPYGTHADQVGDLRLPGGPGPHPVAVLVHGGGWTGPFTRDTMDGIAVRLAKDGLATWNIEYRRIPPVGGWRDTMADVVKGAERLSGLADEHRLDLGHITVVGHSAGSQVGYFAAQRATRQPARFVSLAGMLDLTGLGSDFDDLLSRFMGNDMGTWLRRVDPIRALPLGLPIVAVHGESDRAVSPAQSRRFVDAALLAGDQVALVEIAGAGHADLIDPRAPCWEAVAAACLA